LVKNAEMAMADTFKASLITPEAIVLETTISEAQIPAFDGLLGILDKRAPLLAKLSTGVLRLTTTGGVQRYLVSGGYAQMKDNELTILASEAIPAAEITQQRITGEQAKLDAVQGTTAEAMNQRLALQDRVAAMRSLVGASA
jgi:F-type H+-transporting ATPase subunit epsilon